MDTLDNIPLNVLEAYAKLDASRLVHITSPISASDHNGWDFECTVKVPVPNPVGLPENTLLRVHIPTEYPYDEISIYLDDPKLRGFAHQEPEEGKICLYDEALAPRTNERLVVHLRWALEWLKKAAQNQLLKSGDPYELPHFNPKRNENKILFSEDYNSFKRLYAHLGQWGTVKFTRSDGLPGLFATTFTGEDDQPIHHISWGHSKIKQTKEVQGCWVLLPNICVERHRPPKTFRELSNLLSAHDISLDKLLKEAWKKDNGSYDRAIVLVGFQIPKAVGEKSVEIHWQPFQFLNKRGYIKSKRKTSFTSLRVHSGDLSPEKYIPWTRSENCSEERLLERSSLPKHLRKAKIALLGCGAIGSKLAETLVRGGCCNIDLYDKDEVEYGNLCRHTLTGIDVGGSKALQLALKLREISPFAQITGHYQQLPFSLNSDANLPASAIINADLLVYCAANETVFEWIDHKAGHLDKPLISMFLNASGMALTLIKSSPAHTGSKVLSVLKAAVDAEDTKISKKEYYAEDIPLIRGVGCYHPTFQGKDNHINALISMALDIIYRDKLDEIDFGAIIKINQAPNSSSLVELAYYQQYGISYETTPSKMEYTM